MSDKIKIAVDAMGGDNAPEKVIMGVSHHSNNSQDIIYNIFGDEDLIKNYLNKYKINNSSKIFHTKEKIAGEDSALAAAKKGKNTSMWMDIESVKLKNSYVVISAGNTGALFVIAKLNLEMIDNIDKPALSALWLSLIHI